MREGGSLLRVSRRLGIVLALLAVLGLVGCTSQESKNFSVPALPKDFSLSKMILPLDSFRLSDSELVRMDTDWAELMTRCAARYGATIAYVSDYARDPDSKTLLWGGPFGTISRKQASRFGYHASPGGPYQPAPGFYLKNPDNIVIASGQSPLDELVSYGRPKQKSDPAYSLPLPVDSGGHALPEGGCWSIVQSQINSPLVSDLELRRNLIELSFNDSRTQNAIKNWSSCMRSAGYAYSRPMDAAATAGFLNAAEVSLAVTDVDCTKSSNWASVFYAILIAYQKQAIAKEPQFLQSVLHSQQRVFKTLDALVAK